MSLCHTWHKLIQQHASNSVFYGLLLGRDNFGRDSSALDEQWLRYVESLAIPFCLCTSAINTNENEKGKLKNDIIFLIFA